jgi:hypothetical protein
MSVSFASVASAEVPVVGALPGVGGLPDVGGLTNLGGLPGLGTLPLLGGGQDATERIMAPQDEEGVRWYGVKKSGGLVAITDNNLGPFQACNNDVPINAVGGAVDASGLFAILGSDGNSLTEIRNCDQSNAQFNDGEVAEPLKTEWYGMDGEGALVNISDNNIGPFQVCNNDVPINAVGGAGVISGLVGILSDNNSSQLVRGCTQDSTQEN